MAVVSRIAKLRINTGPGFREWLATAAVQDTPAGASVVITTTLTTSGVFVVDPETLTLNLYNDAGTLIRAFALDTTALSQTATFHFTSDGTATGSLRAGTVEIAIRATRTSAPTYDVETDGTPNDPGVGNTSDLDRGWIRGTTTATTVLSNVALGGAKSSPAEYDESLFARTTLGAALYRARALTVAISSTSPALSAATNSATTGNFDATMTNVVDDRFPAGVTTVSTSLTVPNATLTGQPATVLTVTNDSMTVDPRLTASHHFQVDDNVFARSKDVPAREMLSTQTGFLATRFVTARTGSGANGLSLTQTITPVNPGVAVGPTATSTATRDGEAGWSDLLAWPSAKPGGTWNKTVDITAPTDIDADTHIVSGAQSYTMLAPDPNIVGWPYLSVPGSNETDHAHAGDTLCVTLIVTSQATGKRLLTATNVTCSLVRYHDGQYQFLTADDVTWAEWTSTSVIFSHPMTESPPGSGLWSHEFNTTAAWGDTDILGVTCSWKVGGTPYMASIPREFVGRSNGHDGHSLDPIGLGLSGILSTR